MTHLLSIINNWSTDLDVGSFYYDQNCLIQIMSLIKQEIEATLP